MLWLQWPQALRDPNSLVRIQMVPEPYLHTYSIISCQITLISLGQFELFQSLQRSNWTILSLLVTDTRMNHGTPEKSKVHLMEWDLSGMVQLGLRAQNLQKCTVHLCTQNTPNIGLEFSRLIAIKRRRKNYYLDVMVACHIGVLILLFCSKCSNNFA